MDQWHATRVAIWACEPQFHATEYCQLRDWLVAAEIGSMEELVLMTLVTWSNDLRASTNHTHLRDCRRLWPALRARIEEEACRKIADLGLRLEFPASQILPCLVDAASYGGAPPSVREEGARVAEEILVALPDEDWRVRMTLESSRAKLLLESGRAEAHFLFARLIDAYASDWTPVRDYVQALESMTDRRARYRRIAKVLERAFEQPKVWVDRGDGFYPEELLDHARTMARMGP